MPTTLVPTLALVALGALGLLLVLALLRVLAQLRFRPNQVDLEAPIKPPQPQGTSARLFDLLIALPVLTLSAPLIALGALLVNLDSPGGTLYRARRAGQGGKPFDMLKLRTMRVGSDDPTRRITATGDDRITHTGRLLRATKLDELPQLLNVVRGEMSLIGPRPEDFDLVQAHYDEEALRSLQVRPGVTGWASIYFYPDLFFHDPAPRGQDPQRWYLTRHMKLELRMDMAYEQSRTRLSDLWLLCATPLAILRASFGKPPRRQIAHLAREQAQVRTEGTTC